MRTHLLKLALLLAALPAFAQTVQYPGQFGDNPNQIAVTPGWLYLNKMHYAGTWTATTSYNAQDLVFYGGASYISLQTANMGNAPATSPGWWILFLGSGSNTAPAAWGNILGSMSNQLDLTSALNGKEPSIAPGTTAQFWRGDKTWQPAPVMSFIGRQGAITAQSGDYTTSLVTEGTSLYFTNARAIAAVLPAISGSSPIAFNYLTGVISCPTCGGATVWGGITGSLSSQVDLASALNGKEPSIAPGTTAQFWRGDKTWQQPPVISFGSRTGAIVPISGDYTTAMVTESGNLYFTNPRAIAAVLPALSASSPLGYNSSTGAFTCPGCGAYTGSGTGAVATTVSTVLQVTGRSLDFCTTVDGSTDNTTCLQSALNSLGVKYATLEIEPGSATSGNTAINYVCSKLTWGPASYGHVHILRGAETSCALPAKDGTHDIQNDNSTPPIPDQSYTLQNYQSGAFYACIGGCGVNDLTISGTYTGSQSSTQLCVEISATGTNDTMKWGYSVSGSSCTGGGGPTTITGGVGIALTGTGLTATFAASSGHTAVSGANGDMWLDLLFASTSAPGSLVVTSGGHSAALAAGGIGFGASASPAASQGVQAESALNGVANTAGASLNLSPGAGTGTGASGSVRVASCIPGSSGATQNACTAQWLFSGVNLLPAGDMGTEVFGGASNRPNAKLWNVTANTLMTGSGATGCGSINGCLALTEGSTPPTSTAGNDVCYGDSVTHTIKCGFNGSSLLPLAQLGLLSFDSTAAGLAAPTGNAVFTFPSSTTVQHSLIGTAPASNGSGNGTAEGDIFDVTAGAGGACTAGSACSGGAGGGMSLTLGAGGAANPTVGAGTGAAGGALALNTGAGGASGGASAGNGGNAGSIALNTGNGGAGTANNSSGGNGGAIQISGGNGGAANGSGTGGNGGAILITSGAGGTGGTNGNLGQVSLQQNGTTFLNANANGGLNISSTNAIRTTTIIGGKDTSANAANGGLIARGSDQTGGSGGGASQGGPVLIRGGNNAQSTAASNAGSVLIIAGASTGATQGVQGLTTVATSYIKGATVTQWNLECESATLTVTDCGASAVSWLGVAQLVNTNTVQLAISGQVAVNASAAVTLGHTVCVGTTAGKVTDSGGTAACTAGLTAGVVMDISGKSYTFGDGTTLTTSSTLPLIQIMHF